MKIRDGSDRPPMPGFVHVPLSDAEKLPDPDYGLNDAPKPRVHSHKAVMGPFDPEYIDDTIFPILVGNRVANQQPKPRVFTPEEMEAVVSDAALEARRQADVYVGYPRYQQRHIYDAEALEAAVVALRQAAQVQRERDSQQAKVAELVAWLQAEAKFDPMAPERSFAITDALVEARRLGLVQEGQ